MFRDESSEIYSFWGQKIKGQSHEAQKTVPVWVLALLWVLASFS